MKVALFIAAALLILTGGVWFFQGIGLFPGSFMTGQARWALYGGLAFAVGCGALALALALRRR
jgi:hypothetical protein